MLPLADQLAAATRLALSGQLAPAEQLCQAVLQQQPDHADALHVLGMIALQAGDPDQARGYIERAIAVNRDQPAYWDNLGVAHTIRRNYPAAIAAYEQALRLQPNNANTYYNLAVALVNQGELDRAVTACRQALAINPRSALAYNTLGLALRMQDRLVEAVAAHQQAIRLLPGYTEAFNNLGMALHQQGNLPSAVEAYRHALQLVPSHAEASNNLATALKNLGQLDEALAQYRETLQRHPGHAVACFNLSQFAAEGRYSFLPDDLRRIEEHLVSSRVSLFDRGLLSFTLANVLDHEGSYDEAFRYYRQANELMRQVVQPGGARRYDAQQQHGLVDRIKSLFEPAFFHRVQEWGTHTELPIFIVGMPRSGTTLIEQILATHPRVFGAGELGEVGRLVAELNGEAKDRGPYGTGLSSLTETTVRALSTRYLERLSQLSPGAERVIDKTLGNFLHLGLIAVLFPGARIIHCVRDPLDVCLSCYFQSFQTINFAGSLEDIGSYYREYDRLMAHWRQVLPVFMLEVRYEDLLADQEHTTRQLLAFCNLEWDERCLAFYNTRRPVRTASTLQVRKPLSRASVGRWKRYRAHLQPLLNALQASGPPGTRGAIGCPDSGAAASPIWA